MMDAGMRFLENAIIDMCTPVTYHKAASDREIQAFRAGVSWSDLERVGAAWGKSSSRDYVCRLSDLLGWEPAMGDTIDDFDGTWKVYRMADEECWRRVGTSSLIRIHTKKVG